MWCQMENREAAVPHFHVILVGFTLSSKYPSCLLLLQVLHKAVWQEARQ